MAYQVLARKWRPKLFEEVLGQEHITRALKKSITSERLSHSYLFTGTRGVGKTSVARIFSKALRCLNVTPAGEPCLTCEFCLGIESGSDLDYLELDGASNNSVENMRQLIESAQYSPAKGKYKVFVIDEVHMLSGSAFNALLKTLEEPPAHVVFILATTDPQKIPATILSRCQRFDFRPTSPTLLADFLKKISTKEGFKFQNENVLKTICQHGQGSVRDTLSLLDQILCLAQDQMITDDILGYSLGIAEGRLLDEMVSAIFYSRDQQIIPLFAKIIDSGVNLKSFSVQLLDVVYQKCLESFQNKETTLSKPELIWIYETLENDMRWSLSSLVPHQAMLLSLQKIALRNSFTAESATLRDDGVESGDAIVEEVVLPRKDASWHDLLADLKQSSPALLVQLERGNLVKPLEWVGDVLDIELGFVEANQVFKDYLEDRETIISTRRELCRYFQVSEKNLIFKIVSVAEAEFKSVVDEELDVERQENEKKTKELLEDKFVKQAEALFSVRPDKYILKSELK